MVLEKRYKDIKFNNKEILSLSKYFNVNENIIKFLFCRGITTKEKIDNFLNSSLNDFFNPFGLKNMNEAVKSINNAISSGKRIVIVGDYDTDGICSTAILYKYFESVGVKTNYFLPNRFSDGYGLTIETVDKIIDKFDPEFIITVDCGISCYKEVEYIKNKGIEIIVTDHHEIPEIIPNCICIDPKLNSDYPFKELCGAGVALKVVQALAGLNVALQYTCIAALATIADIVPLKSENRAIVKHGLKNTDSLPIGVKKLIESLNIKDLNSTDISFKIAPKLNTAGRMGDATTAFKLFIEKNPIEINDTLILLEEQNNCRIEAGNIILEDCLNQLSNTKVSKLKSIVLYSDNWHSGVLGIVCAKLTDMFNRPVCLLTKVDNVYRGSIRSIPGIDIFKELTKCSDLLLKFGGHSGAGGLTIEEEKLDLFRNTLNENISKEYDNTYFEITKYYDFDLNKDDIDIDFVKELNLLEPFGFGNEKPIFKYTFNNIKPERIKNHPNFIKFKTPKFEMISFSLSEYFDSFSTNCNKNVLLDLSVETYKSVERLKGIIKNISFDKLNTGVKTDITYGYYAKQLIMPKLSHNNNICTIAEDDIENIVKSNYGTLFVSNSLKSYNYAVSKFSKLIKNYETYSVKDMTGCNTLLFMVKNTSNFSNFENVIFLDDVIKTEYLNGFDANIYLCSRNNDDEMLKDLDTDRKTFAIYHNAIKQTVVKGQYSFSEQEYFNLVKRNTKYKMIKFNQFVFVVMVLSELGILDVKSELNYFEIKINKDVTSQLTNSSIYNFVRLYNKIEGK